MGWWVQARFQIHIYSHDIMTTPRLDPQYKDDFDAVFSLLISKNLQCKGSFLKLQEP
jgi:hypothetical protein